MALYVPRMVAAVTGQANHALSCGLIRIALRFLWQSFTSTSGLRFTGNDGPRSQNTDAQGSRYSALTSRQFMPLHDVPTIAGVRAIDFEVAFSKDLTIVQV